VFGRTTKAELAEDNERLRQQLADTREELDTERRLRGRQIQRVDALLIQCGLLTQQRTNARNVAERANNLIRDHVCVHVPESGAKVAEENARLRGLVAGLQAQLLALQDANASTHAALPQERDAVTAESAAA
jgi:hypothetical protein